MGEHVSKAVKPAKSEAAHASTEAERGSRCAACAASAAKAQDQPQVKAPSGAASPTVAAPPFKVAVRLVRGSHVTLYDLSPHDTVAVLYTKLAEKITLHDKYGKIIHQGKDLLREKRLVDYAIGPDTILTYIHVVTIPASQTPTVPRK